jgi:hypothetical protein
VQLEGLGQLKNSNDLIGNRTRELPACSIVPQRTTLSRAQSSTKEILKYTFILLNYNTLLVTSTYSYVKTSVVLCICVFVF